MQASKRTLFVILSCAFALLATTPAHAQRGRVRGAPTIDGTRLVLFFGTDFGGTYHDTMKAPNGTTVGTAAAPLDAGAILGLRIGASFGHYFLLSGQFRTTFWQRTPDDTTHAFLDFDVVPEIRIPVTRRGRIFFEPHVLIPAGFTLVAWNGPPSDPPLTSSANAGFNIGFIPGITILSRRGLGGTFDLGYMHHSFFGSDAANNHYHQHTDQGTFQVGFVYVF